MLCFQHGDVWTSAILGSAKTTFLIGQVNPSHARGKFLPEFWVAVQ